MRYAVIDQTNTVVEILVTENGPLDSSWQFAAGQVALQSDTAQCGWTYAGGSFTAPTLTAAQIAQGAAAAALAGGLQIISTSTSALNGTYSLSQNSQSYIDALMTCINATGAFFNGATSQVYYDAQNTPHTFPSVAEFKAFSLAVGGFVDSVERYALSGGISGSIPSQPVTIA